MIKTLFTALRAFGYAAVFVWLWAWLALTLRPLDARLGLAPPAWLGPPGWAIAALGGLVVLSCLYFFVSVGKGTPAIFDAPRAFVAVGPYRLVRNPMYIGAAGVILGSGLGVGSILVSALAGAFLVIAHLFVVLYEEPVLRRTFGAGYADYCRVTNRWLPGRAGAGLGQPGTPP